ncbi:MAG: response regulator, partial [Marinomonas sp.]
LAREGDIPSRQIDNFQTTLSKVHQNFFDSPKVRSEAYLLEMELYSALGDKKTMNQIEEVWNHDIESGNAEPTSDTVQKRITQLKA